MPHNNVHMRFRDVVSVNLLFAALEKNFPLFLSMPDPKTVDDGGNASRENVFHALKDFSTNFPQSAVEEKS
jgi:hypothetical protein